MPTDTTPAIKKLLHLTTTGHLISFILANVMKYNPQSYAIIIPNYIYILLTGLHFFTNVMTHCYFLINCSALAGVAQWIEHQPLNQNGAGLIHIQGTCLDCGPGLQLRAC